MVASSIPTWQEDAPKVQEDAPKVQEYLAQSGVDLGPVIASGDSTAIAKLLYTAQMNVRLGETNRKTKRAAQTMSGSNSGDDSTTEWDRIKVARGLPSFRV